jgi:putative PIN family toxin of toxin-antitoxin system
MTTAILDTNVIVQAAIAHSRSSSVRVLRAFDDGKFRLLLSQERIDEYLDVLALPHIRERHGWSDEQVLDFVVSLLTNAAIYTDLKEVSASIARDVTDASLLALGDKSPANQLWFSFLCPVLQDVIPSDDLRLSPWAISPLCGPGTTSHDRPPPIRCSA